MFLKECRCGKSKKNFKMDIGPFYIDECCSEAGYDCQGNKVGESSEPESTFTDTVQCEPLISREEELSKMSAKELKKLAQEMGIEKAKYMSKKDLVKAILG